MGSAISRKKDGSSTVASAPSDSRKLFHSTKLDRVKWNPKRGSTASSNKSDKADKADNMGKKWKGPRTQMCKSIIGSPSNFQHLGHMGGSGFRTSGINMHEATSPTLIPIDQPEPTVPFLKSLDETSAPPSEQEIIPVSDILSPPPRSPRERDQVVEEIQRYQPKSSRRKGRRPFSYDHAVINRSAQQPIAPPMDRGLNLSATGRVMPVSYKNDSLTLSMPKHVPLKDCSSGSDSRPQRRHSGSSFASSSSSSRSVNGQAPIAIGQPIWDPKQINSVWNEFSASAPSTMRRSVQNDFLRRSCQEEDGLTGLGLGPRPTNKKSRDAARRYASRSDGSMGLDLETSALFGLHEGTNNSTRSLSDKPL